jgi:hypothetical protein
LVPVLHSTRTVVSASRLEPTDDRSTRCSTQKRDLGDPSLALSDGCNGLRTRSLKPRRVAVSNPRTVIPLKPCASLASGANSTHPSPSARHFRLPFNGLAPSELRRIFCSDEGVFAGQVKVCMPNDPPACPAWGGVALVPMLHSMRTAISASRESRLRRPPLHGETRRRSALSAASTARRSTEAHAAAVRSAISGIRR